MTPDLDRLHPDRAEVEVDGFECARIEDYRELWEIARGYEKIILKEAPLVKEAIAARIEARVNDDA